MAIIVCIMGITAIGIAAVFNDSEELIALCQDGHAIYIENVEYRCVKQ